MPHQPLKPIEDIACEVGRYPVDAYLFVQECIGLAAERVHGPMSADQREVAHWMAEEDVTPETLVDRWESGNLPPKIVAAVERIGGPRQMNRHVSGQELCRAIRDIAQERWGLMARGVLSGWHIHRTEDLGAIVFALVEHHWLAKQRSDRIEDFCSVFSFSEAFEKQYQIGS